MCVWIKSTRRSVASQSWWGLRGEQSHLRPFPTWHTQCWTRIPWAGLPHQGCKASSGLHPVQTTCSLWEPPVCPLRKNVKRGKGSAGGHHGSVEETIPTMDNKSPLQKRRLAFEGRGPLQPSWAGWPRTCQGRRTKEEIAEWWFRQASPSPPFLPPDPPAHLFPPPVPTKAKTEGSLNFQWVFQMK